MWEIEQLAGLEASESVAKMFQVREAEVALLEFKRKAAEIPVPC
jgi:hypothetical protein